MPPVLEQNGVWRGAWVGRSKEKEQLRVPNNETLSSEIDARNEFTVCILGSLLPLHWFL